MSDQNYNPQPYQPQTQPQYQQPQYARPQANPYMANQQYAQTPQYEQQQYMQYRYGQQPYMGQRPADTGSFGWAVLGFFFPIVGLILFLVWKTEKPVSAKQAGMGALVSVVAAVVLWCLLIVFAAIIGSAVTY